MGLKREGKERERARKKKKRGEGCVRVCVCVCVREREIGINRETEKRERTGFLYIMLYSLQAFNDFFSRSLALEFQGKIDFLSLRPGYFYCVRVAIYEGGWLYGSNHCLHPLLWRH